MEKTLRRLPRACIRRPRLTIVVLLTLVLCAVPGLLRLRLRTDGHALVPPHDSVVQLDDSIRRHFGLRDTVVILVVSDSPGGIYNLETLSRVRQLSDALAAIPGIGAEHVMSLATERRNRVYPGTLEFRPFLDPLPTTPALMEQLRSDVAATGILTGTLVSADASATTILVGVPEAADRVPIYDRIQEVVEPLRTSGERVVVVGAPVAEALLGRYVLDDLALLVPLCITFIALVVWVGCRRLWGVVLAVTEVGACLVWTFGIMGWLGVPVYLTVAVLPVILTTIGLADEIHVFWYYQRRLAGDEASPHPAAVQRAMDDMVRPVVLTSLTTAVGFLSFLVSDIVPVRAFGVFAAAGVLFCMMWSLTVVPAALTLIAPERMRRPRQRSGRGWTLRAASPLTRRPRLALGGVLLLSLVAALGLRSLHVQDSWIDGFARQSPFRRATDEVNSKLLGTHVLLAHLEFEPLSSDLPAELAGRAPLVMPHILDAIRDFEDFVSNRAGVGGVLGPHSHLAAVRDLFMGRRASQRTLPRDPRVLDMLLGHFDRGRGVHRRREVIDDARRRAVVTVFIENANYRDTAVLMEEMREHAEARLSPLGGRLDFAGDVAVSQAMIRAVVRTQVASLVLALFGALVAVSFLLRSLRVGLCAILPAAVAVLWVFGALGWLGIPLGVATSMFCAITLGIGVDYAIHFLEAVRRARSAGRGDAIGHALAEAGPAIVTDTLAVVPGFGLLAISQVPANARLGLIVALALTASCVLTLIGLGALLNVSSKSQPRSWTRE